MNLNNYYLSGEFMPTQVQVVIAIIFGFLLGWKVFETILVQGVVMMVEQDDDAITYNESADTLTINIRKIKLLSGRFGDGEV